MVKKVSKEAGGVVWDAAIAMSDHLSFGMKIWEEVCEDEIEDDPAIHKYYGPKGQWCNEMAEYAGMSFSMVDVTFESADLCWEKMGIGLC